jgi:hypothetical protein
VILWQLVHWQKPYDGLETMQIIYKVGIKREILPISSDCKPDLARLMKSCMNYNEEDRPNFAELKIELTRIGNLI